MLLAADVGSMCVCVQLFYHLQKDGFFPEPRAAFYAAEMTTALGYLHSISIVYRCRLTDTDSDRKLSCQL